MGVGGVRVATFVFPAMLGGGLFFAGCFEEVIVRAVVVVVVRLKGEAPVGMGLVEVVDLAGQW